MQIIELLFTGILSSFLPSIMSAFACRKDDSYAFLAVWVFAFVVLVIAYFFEPAFYVYLIMILYYYAKLFIIIVAGLIKALTYKSRNE